MKTISIWFRQVLRQWRDRRRWRRLMAEDRAAYRRQPVHPDEFDGLIAAPAVDFQEPRKSENGDDW